MARAITILGRAKLDRQLRRMPAVVKAQVRAAMEGQADDIVRMMRNLAPEDDGVLRASIGWTWGRPPKGSMTIAKVKTQLGAELTLTIFAGNSEAYYARWVEFGTDPHVNGGLFAGSENPGTKARPFFYVSWRASKKQSVRKIRAAVRKGVKQAAAGG